MPSQTRDPSPTIYKRRLPTNILNWWDHLTKQELTQSRSCLKQWLQIPTQNKFKDLEENEEKSKHKGGRMLSRKKLNKQYWIFGNSEYKYAT